MRVERWDVVLLEFADAVIKEEYEWGTSDCVSVTRRALSAILGRDPWKDHIGTWKTMRGALKVVKKIDPAEVLLASGAVEVGYNFASAGDVALLPDEDDGYPFPHIALVLHRGKHLVAHPDNGIRIIDPVRNPLTRIFRYE